MKSRFVWAGCAAAMLALAIGCGSSSSPTSATPNGNFRVMLQDTPFGDAKAVLVTFSEVTVHPADGEWTTVVSKSRTCDLKQLQKAQDVLGAGTLTAGHYTQARLAVTSAALYFENAAATGPCADSIKAPDGKNALLDIPPDKIILNRGFDVGSSGTTTMVLDFDGDKSITQTGNGTYKMKPVISVVSVQ